jgi:predicted ATP-grasp superfamily ATP-dependent carboligase
MRSDRLRWPADPSTPAVVLKLDPNVFHHGALGVVRTLGRLGVPMHVVHEDILAPAAASRYVSGRWRWNPGGDDTERIAQGLGQLAERIGRPAVLIPIDDAGSIFLAEHGERLRDQFLFPAPKHTLPRQLAAKQSLAELCRDGPIRCPETVLPCSLEEAYAFVDRVGLPVFAKLAMPWRRPGGPRLPSTSRVVSARQLVDLYPAHAAGTSDPILLQQCVPGGHSADWFFHGYCDATSAPRPAFTGVKERSYPPRAGLTTFGRAVRNERLVVEVSQMLAKLGYRGIVDLDLRWDAREDQYKLLDFNPRIGAQFRLFENASGLDVARAAYLDLTRQPAPAEGLDDGIDSVPFHRPDQGAAGRRFLVENYDVLAAIRYRRLGELDLRSWARSLRGVDETAWFARDDLVPFGLMCLRLGWRLLERLLHRRPRSPDTLRPRYRPGRALNLAGPVRPAALTTSYGKETP